MGTRLERVRALLRHRAVWLGTLTLALLLGGTVVAAWFCCSYLEAERHWKLAEAALEQQDLAAGRDHLRRCLEIRPGSGECHLLLAQTLRREGAFDEADHHRGEARRLGWDLAAVRREAALAELQRRSVREMAGNDLLALVQSNRPDRPTLEALYRGDLAFRTWDRAGLWLHLWLERYPDDWAPRLWQAELLERFKKYDRARADYLRVLELRPDQPRALLGAGLTALASRGDYAEAEEYLGRYLARDAGHAGATLGLARCRYGRGDVAAACETIQAVLASNPRHAEAALLLGTIEGEAGRDEEALRWLRVAETEGADLDSICYQLAQILVRLDRAEEASAYQRRFTERRDAFRALEAAIRAADREPDNADRMYEVGRLNRVLGDEDVAAQWFRDALKRNPTHRPSHAALADYYGRQPDHEAAARAEYHRDRAKAALP